MSSIRSHDLILIADKKLDLVRHILFPNQERERVNGVGLVVSAV